MKTNILTPTFYLVSPELVINIKTKTIIGRAKGNVILEDDDVLSSIHCELNPKVTEIFIRDLHSTNGVFVNKQKIFPDTDVKLNVGDVIKFGKSEYVLYDNEAAVKKVLPRVEKRKYPRPKTLYGPENIINFYSAPNLFRGIYLLTILLALASFLLNLQLEIPLPLPLQFLSIYYSENIVFSGIKLVFVVWAISFIHSFLLVVYFNRNPLRKGVSLALYCVVMILLVDFSKGPLGGLKRYVVERQAIENLKYDDKAIIYLKELTNHKEALTKSYKFSISKLPQEHHEVLKKDFELLVAKINQELDKIDKH